MIANILQLIMKSIQFFFSRLCLPHLILVTTTGLILPSMGYGQAGSQSNHFTTSDGVRLHYLAAGKSSTGSSTESTIVFVPGWTMPGWIWEHQISYFAKRHRVIAFDPRGQGESEKPPFGYDHSRRALDIGELIAHLDSNPVILVGWSLGVLEVMKYLEQHGTSAIRALVLVDWATYYENPAMFSDRYISLQTEREEWTRKFIKAIYRSDQSEEYFEKVTQVALQTPTNAAAIMIGNIILQGDTDLRPFMEVLDRPTLFIYSSNAWSVTAAEKVRKDYPKFQVEIIEDSGHTLFVDQPQEFNHLLETFVKSIPK